MKKSLCFILLVPVLAVVAAKPAQSVAPVNPFKGNLGPAPVGGSFRMKDYIVWGGSVIKEDDGRYYMFATRWPRSGSWRNWVVSSEIVLASSDKAEGPYEFEQVVLPARGPGFWDGMSTLNPSIHRHNGKYILFYTGTTHDLEMLTETISRDTYETVWNSKRVGVAVADSLYGPWERMDRPILEPRPGKWDGAITSNPAPVVHEDGSVLLIYKSAPVPYPERNENRALHLGVATAPHILGPYTRMNEGKRLQIERAEDAHVEDPYIWQADGFYHMMAKTFGDNLTGEGDAGLYAFSRDGIRWSLAAEPKAYSRTVLFRDGTRRTYKRAERPFVLLQNGRPAYLFLAVAEPEWADVYNLVIPLN